MKPRLLFLLGFDLYWLRYRKPGEQWYELTDFVRDTLRAQGYQVDYTADDVIIDGHSMKRLAQQESAPCHSEPEATTLRSAPTSAG